MNEHKMIEMKARLGREVLLQYPTYSVWKYASNVTLEEAERYKILAERWGNSSEGYIVNEK